MHILRFISCVLLVCLTVSSTHAARDEQSAIIAGMPISDVLSFYEELLGQKIITASEVKTMKAAISVRIQNKSKQEILKILDEMLAQQAGVEISREPDGSYLARRLVTRK